MTNLQPWYWRSLSLFNRTGSEIFATLFLDTDASKIATLLESPYPNQSSCPELSRYSICASAPRIVNGKPQMWTPPLGEVLPFLQQLLIFPPSPLTADAQLGETPHSDCLPFTGGWLGWLGYDVAREIEVIPDDKIDPLPFPVAFWYEPECFAILDHAEQILWLAASLPRQLDELEEKLDRESKSQKVKESRSQGDRENNSSFPPSPPHLFTSREDYEAAVNRAKKYIQAGDIFQANISLRFQALSAASGWEIYQTLQKINPSPFASYWLTPWGEVISCSPERLVKLESCRDGISRVSTRPIAGTRSRGKTVLQDNQLAQDLLSNTKERAEHIMLVDLERNDLGRVCEWGSVAVDELLTIERYSHVMHLVSNVKGILKRTSTPVDLIRALFPGGTITGCPKVRCMEIISELEPVRRSLFYGSCGYLDWRGNLDLNILIRTLLLTSAGVGGVGDRGMGGVEESGGVEGVGEEFNIVWGQVGAGIVADSDPGKEWDESLHKAEAQLKALKILNDQKG